MFFLAFTFFFLKKKETNTQILLHRLLPGPALLEPTEALPSSCTERWGRRWKRKQWRGHHWGGPLHFRAIQAINPPHTHLFFKPLLSSSNLKIAGLVLAHQMLMTLAESAVMPMQVLNIYLCKLFKCRFFYFIFFYWARRLFCCVLAGVLIQIFQYCTE